jgi:hypothetical protein
VLDIIDTYDGLMSDTNIVVWLALDIICQEPANYCC